MLKKNQLQVFGTISSKQLRINLSYKVKHKAEHFGVFFILWS